jgi:hypothetical protein
MPDMPAETALEKSLQQSLAAADASEAAAAAGACEAPIVEISLRPAQDETAGAKKKAAGQAKLGKPPVVVSSSNRCQQCCWQQRLQQSAHTWSHWHCAVFRSRAACFSLCAISVGCLLAAGSWCLPLHFCGWHAIKRQVH